MTPLICYWSVAWLLFFCYLSPIPPGWFGRNHYIQEHTQELTQELTQDATQCLHGCVPTEELTLELTHELTHELVLTMEDVAGSAE